MVKKIWNLFKAALDGKTYDYTQGSLNKAIFLLAIPMILELSLESIFAVVDIFFVGKLGPNAIAAVGFTESILTLIYSVAIGLSTAASAIIARRVGEKNIDDAKRRATLLLKQNENAFRYKPYGFLDDLATRMSAGVASIVVSRAGSTIFEIASWALPSIIIPITDSNGDHQRKNAFNYARSGACIVIEEANLSPHVFLSELERLQSLPETQKRMSEKATAFFKPHAARSIAEEIVRIAFAIELISKGSTKIAASPATSGIEEVLEVITAVSALKASIIGIPNPSKKET